MTGALHSPIVCPLTAHEYVSLNSDATNGIGGRTDYMHTLVNGRVSAGRSRQSDHCKKKRARVHLISLFYVCATMWYHGCHSHDCTQAPLLIRNFFIFSSSDSPQQIAIHHCVLHCCPVALLPCFHCCGIIRNYFHISVIPMRQLPLQTILISVRFRAESYRWIVGIVRVCVHQTKNYNQTMKRNWCACEIKNELRIMTWRTLLRFIRNLFRNDDACALSNDERRRRRHRRQHKIINNKIWRNYFIGRVARTK